jgi:hypothetical protein
MSIPLDTPTTGGPPAVRLGDIGSYIDVGIVNVEDVQSRNFDTGEPEVWDDGKPKMHPRITGLVITSQGMTVGKDTEERDPQPGELVSIYAQGGRLYPWRDAKKAHGTVHVGDVLRWKFETTEAPRNPKFRGNPRKVIAATLRAPRGDDGDLVARCEDAHHNLRTRVTVDNDTSSSPDPTPF